MVPINQTLQVQEVQNNLFFIEEMVVCDFSQEHMNNKL